MLKEKEDAWKEIVALNKEWHRGNPGLEEEFYRTYCNLFDIFELYVKMYRLVGKSYIWVKYLQKQRNKATLKKYEEIISEMKRLIADMKAVEQELKDHKPPVQFKYQFLAMMNPERLRVYYEDVESILQGL
jgi:hypothetical protein